MTGTLMETYLGHDAGRRVFSRRIMRGIADRIDAVIWFSDLRGFTRITDSSPEQIIPLLNDYADVMVSAIHAHGGDVLKLIGDGILATSAVPERLDFTVVGPAVNETRRIVAMCRSVEQPMLVSQAFANVDGMRGRLMSVGRYALRGVAQPQELFALDASAQLGADIKIPSSPSRNRRKSAAGNGIF
jgi:adenylate cyclase